MALRREACEFCDELHAPNTSRFARMYGPGSSRVVLDHEAFLVWPSLGRLGEKHLLVVPQRHVRGFAELSSSLQDEAAALVRRIRAAIGRTVVFEHGLGPVPTTRGCGVAHAHLHIVAVPDEIPALEPPHRLQWRLLPRPLQLQALPRDVEYAFFVNQEDQAFVADARGLPSQFIRRWLAAKLGQPEWDWRAAGPEEAVLAQVRELRDRLTSSTTLIT